MMDQVKDKEQTPKKKTPEVLFKEGPRNNNGLIDTILWSFGDRHGSVLLAEPYRYEKTPEELRALGLSQVDVVEFLEG